jgi:hypothetical protein
VEQRWLFIDNLFDMLSAGAVVFTDAARTWGPGSAGKGWHAGVGMGLRLALPTISPDHVLRIDMAWPLQADFQGERKAILSFGSSQAF